MIDNPEKELNSWLIYLQDILNFHVTKSLTHGAAVGSAGNSGGKATRTFNEKSLPNMRRLFMG